MYYLRFALPNSEQPEQQLELEVCVRRAARSQLANILNILGSKSEYPEQSGTEIRVF